ELAAGQTRVEVFTVASVDGTAHEVAITIVGVNDAATIGGVDAGVVTEDAASPTLTYAGTLQVTDVDGAAEQAFGTTVVAPSGALVTLTITSGGASLYLHDAVPIQELAAGQTRVEVFTVASVD